MTGLDAPHRPAWLLSLLTAAVLLSGCGPSGSDDGARMAALRSRLAATLHDYPSAGFRGVRVKAYAAAHGPALLACGEVNDRNAAGAYQGFQPFAVSSDASFAPRIGQGAAAAAFAQVCDYPGPGWSSKDRSLDIQDAGTPF